MNTIPVVLLIIVAVLVMTLPIVILVGGGKNIAQGSRVRGVIYVFIALGLFGLFYWNSSKVSEKHRKFQEVTEKADSTQEENKEVEKD